MVLRHLKATAARRHRRIAVGTVGAAVVVALVLGFVAVAETPDETLTVAFLDVGQGDAVFIEAPSGRQMLIDGGPSKRVLRKLGSQMWFWDRSIDAVVASHPDKDHIGGLGDVLEVYDVGAVLRSGATSSTEVFDAWRGAIEREDAAHRTIVAGQSIRLSPRVRFDVLFPPRSIDVTAMEPNKASVVGRLVYGDTAFLLSGDAPKAVEEYIAGRYGGNLASQVLKAGHHGSDTSTGKSWLGWADPKWAVVSAGKDNRYGHPAPSVVERLKRFGIEILQTKKRGTVIFESDGKRVRLVE